MLGGAVEGVGRGAQACPRQRDDCRPSSRPTRTCARASAPVLKVVTGSTMVQSPSQGCAAVGGGDADQASARTVQAQSAERRHAGAGGAAASPSASPCWPPTPPLSLNLCLLLPCSPPRPTTSTHTPTWFSSLSRRLAPSQAGSTSISCLHLRGGGAGRPGHLRVLLGSTQLPPSFPPPAGWEERGRPAIAGAPARDGMVRLCLSAPDQRVPATRANRRMPQSDGVGAWHGAGQRGAAAPRVLVARAACLRAGHEPQGG